MFDNFAQGGTMSEADIYGSRGPGGAGGYQTAVAPITESASGPMASAGVGPAWSWVGFVLLLVAARVLIELGGEVDTP